MEKNKKYEGYPKSLPNIYRCRKIAYLNFYIIKPNIIE